jgi:hypothetical protein
MVYNDRPGGRLGLDEFDVYPRTILAGGARYW